jgi:hypothetical protein
MLCDVSGAEGSKLIERLFESIHRSNYLPASSKFWLGLSGGRSLPARVCEVQISDNFLPEATGVFNRIGDHKNVVSISHSSPPPTAASTYSKIETDIVCSSPFITLPL